MADDMIIDDNEIVVLSDVKCLKAHMFYKYLNISADTCRRKIIKDNVKVIKQGGMNYISIENLYKLKEKQTDFWNKHIDAKSARDKYGMEFLKDKSTVKPPYYAKTIDISRNFSYIKSELETAFKLVETDNNRYISRQEAKNILCLSDINLRRTVVDYGVKFKKRGSYYVYLAEDIDFFKHHQDELVSIYVSCKEVSKLYSGALTQIDSYTIPSFARKKDVIEKSAVSYYNKNELRDFLKIKELRKLFHSIDDDIPFQTYREKLLLIDSFNNFSKSPYTRDKWISFVSNYLDNSNLNKRGLTGIISNFVYLACSLEDFLIINGGIEIYSLSSSQLNLLLSTMKNKKTAFYLYKFIALISQDIELKLKSVNSSNKNFIFKSVKHPMKTNNINKDNELTDEIYEFKEYKALFTFLTDMKYHKHILFKDNITIREKGVYLSTWLYLILHLNNAWRNGDITTFPRLCFNDLEAYYNISTFEWFKDNEVPLDLAKQVISHITKYEFRVDKTRVDGHFFCSDALAPTLATTLLMLDICIKYDYIGVEKAFNEPVMLFFNKYNEPNPQGIKPFLTAANIDNFVFGSRKMNKSLMSYIYALADEKDALLMPQYMRSHVKGDTTLHYLNLNKKDIDFLTEQLFIRGEFGYIYDTLVNLVNGENHSLEEKTDIINDIKNTFGDELKIEATLGLANYFNDERKEIMQLLSDEGYDKCLKKANDIYMNKLPSREELIQCLYSIEGCRCPEIKKCIDCKYSIPSIYVLNTLCESIKTDFKNYEKSVGIPQKIKIAARLFRKKTLLKEAINRYGRDYIYSMLDMTNSDFLDTFSRVLKPDELLPLLKETT